MSECTTFEFLNMKWGGLKYSYKKLCPDVPTRAFCESETCIKSSRCGRAYLIQVVFLFTREFNHISNDDWFTIVYVSDKTTITLNSV